MFSPSSVLNESTCNFAKKNAAAGMYAGIHKRNVFHSIDPSKRSKGTQHKLQNIFVGAFKRI